MLEMQEYKGDQKREEGSETTKGGERFSREMHHFTEGASAQGIADAERDQGQSKVMQ